MLAAALAVACAVATFVEKDWGSQAARAEVYETWWFRLLLGLLTLFLASHLLRRRWWRPERLPLALMHGGAALVLIGAMVTWRYGMEGFVHLREGQTGTTLLSRRPFLTVTAVYGADSATVQVPVSFSPRKKVRLSAQLAVGGVEIGARVTRYVAEGVREIVAHPTGGPAVALTVVDGNARQIVVLGPGEVAWLAGVVLACDTTVADSLPVVTFSVKGDRPAFCATQPVVRQAMRDTALVRLPAHEHHPLEPLQLYMVGQVRWALRSFLPQARVTAVPAREIQPPVDPSSVEEALELELRAGQEHRLLTLFGGTGVPGSPQQVALGQVQVSATFGSLAQKLPFALQLLDFAVERYPGSDRPSMFISKVVVVDAEHGVRRAAEVFMNHPLAYRGHRFFQTSYDDDELGSVLTVAADPGRTVVYAGFVFLGGGLVLWLLMPGLRRGRMPPAPDQRVLVSVLGLTLAAVLTSGSSRQEVAARPREAHVRAFAALPVLDADGRVKPMDTFAREIVQKVSGQSRLERLEPAEALLDMMTHPERWQRVPMILVEDHQIRAVLGLSERQKARFADFFAADGRYRLAHFLHAVNRKPAAERDRHDRELLKTDERASICYLIFRGFLPRLLPHPQQPEHSLSYQEVRRELRGEAAARTQSLYETYLQAVRGAERGGSWEEATRALRRIQDYQQQHARELLPSRSRLQAEIVLNRLQPFQRLLPVYLAMGVVLTALALGMTLSARLPGRQLVAVAKGLLLAAFLVHTGALVLRWYAAGHAPWSNAYESMVYIAWAATLAGVVYSRRSVWLPAATCLLAAAALLVAHLTGMDPQITPLVPVLKSGWLVIHVSTITASYGFFGLGALLALVVLTLTVVRTKGSTPRLEPVIGALATDCSRLVKVGFALLCIGTMFGAVWADVSWGRYWGWDPKETWTLITILAYVVTLHLAHTPGVRNPLTFPTLSLVGFASVLMTYFGVNYYLTGLHSYAQGQPFPIPFWVYAAAGAIVVLTVTAFLRSARVRAQSG